MNAIARSPARKRPVNLTLSDDLVKRARTLSGNLSAVVETLLTDYVRQQNQARQTRRHEAALIASGWNDFNTAIGSFADDHSTL